MENVFSDVSAATHLNDQHASCFFAPPPHRYLISQGASVGVVNSEGETPLDIAEEEAMGELLKNEINRQGEVEGKGVKGSESTPHFR